MTILCAIAVATGDIYTHEVSKAEKAGAPCHLWIYEFPANQSKTPTTTTYNSCYSACQVTNCCIVGGCEGVFIMPSSCNCWCPNECPKILENTKIATDV